MDKLLEISQILVRYGNKLDDHSPYRVDGGYIKHITEHCNIISISIFVHNGTDISMYIDVKPLSVKMYLEQEYVMDKVYNYDILVCGSRDFQSFEDLLDELQDLGLIKYGHNIKGSSS